MKIAINAFVASVLLG